MISLEASSDFRLPLISIAQQFFLVVEQFFMCLCGEFKVGALNNCINRTGLLTEAAIDAFSHVNVVARRTPASIRSRLCLDSNGLGWADGFTQFACNAALLAGWVPPKSMFPSESGAERSFLKWVIDCGWFFEEMSQCHSKT